MSGLLVTPVAGLLALLGSFIKLPANGSEVSGDQYKLDFVDDDFASNFGCVEGGVARVRLLAR